MPNVPTLLPVDGNLKAYLSVCQFGPNFVAKPSVSTSNPKGLTAKILSNQAHRRKAPFSAERPRANNNYEFNETNMAHWNRHILEYN